MMTLLLSMDNGSKRERKGEDREKKQKMQRSSLTPLTLYNIRFSFEFE